MLGRVFSYKALVLSKALFKHSESSNLWHDLVGQICQLAVEIPWLREECGLVLYDAVKMIRKENLSRAYIEDLVNILSQKKLYQTPQGVAIWLSIYKDCHDIQLPKGIWHHQDPLNSKERSCLATVMREDYSQTHGDTEANTSGLKSGFSMPQISFAWDVLIIYLTRITDSSHEKQLKKFGKFWKEVVDGEAISLPMQRKLNVHPENLFASTASLERKAWGFQVFSRAIQLLPQWALPVVFSPQLMKCIVNHRTDTRRYLNNASKLPLEAIQSRAKRERSTAKLFICQLTGINGALHFDELTKTKTLEELLALAEPGTLREIILHFEHLAVKPSTNNQSEAETQRRALADLCLSLLRRQSKIHESLHDLKADGSWLKELFTFLVKCAYFKPRPGNAELTPEPEISEVSKNIFRTRLSSCFTCLVEKKLNEDDFWIGYVVSKIQSIQETDTRLIQDFTSDKTLLKHLQKYHDSLNYYFLDVSANFRHHVNETDFTKTSKDNQLGEIITAFRLLYSFSLLQLYNGESDAIATMGDLESLFKPGPQRLKMDSRTIVVLVDIVISVLSKSSVLSRLVAVRCFTALTHVLNEDVINSLYEILEKPENVSGQNDLYAQDESVDDLKSDVDSNELKGGNSSETDSSTEMEDEEDISDGVEALNNDDGEKNPSSSSDDDGNDEELSKFNSLLADVLQVQAKEETEQQNDSSNESDMDDEQMMALEPHLTNIFRERKKTTSRKREQKDAKETMIVLKNRILDLLLIFIRKQHSNSLSITLILPLLQLMRTTSSKQLAEKAFGHLKQYYDTCKSKGMPIDVCDEVLWENLKNIHVEATKATSKMTQSACSRSSLHTAKILISKDYKNYNGLVEQYALTQKSWYMDPKSKIYPTMFTEWISWSIGTRARK